mmetsp:Transcript_28800/g.73421  ORF Transcript_28800/g.73421 Transcript_28800/m.73421 type:complete len:584 (-) Transcript_28800:963-2714(-)
MSTVTRNLLCLLSRGQPMTGYPYGLLWTPYQSGFTGPYGLASSVAHAGLHNVGVHRHATRRGVIKAFLAFINLVSFWLSILRAAYDYAVLLTASLPRTMRTAVWLMRAGLSYKIHLARIASEDPESDKVQEIMRVLHTRWARELLSVCRANGGVYIKAGQFASAFGAVPVEYRQLLRQLEDKATPRPYADIRRVLRAELGRDAEGLFSEFETTATAAASLAQVHRARLVTGEEVAVKVQYPGLAARVAADLAVMKLFNTVAALLFPNLHLGWLYTELEQKLAVELDFRTEVRNASRLSCLLVGNPRVSVPIMVERLCGPRILVMEWIAGVKINDLEGLRARHISPRAVGLALVKLYAQLTFVDGFMHADPHPGNLMVREKGKPGLLSWLLGGSRQPFEVVLLDHGTYLDIDKQMRQQFCQLWCSFVTADKVAQAELSTALAGERGTLVLPVLLTHAARTREEERALQRSVGINGFGDMAALLQHASRELVELLRINTIIRGVANQLGIGMEERKRIFATFARKGLPPRWQRGPQVHPHFNSLFYRMKLLIVLNTWRTAVHVKYTGMRLWSAVLAVLGDVLFAE